MAEGNAHSRYVRLTKEQAPVEDITPGELNQPIEVPQSWLGNVNVNVISSWICLGAWEFALHSLLFERKLCFDVTSYFGSGSSFGWTGLFCPCVLFGRNVETLREDIPWTNGCVCHALCVEGGMAIAAATALFHGIDPKTSFLICESLFFAWWMCGIYTGLFRQSLQKKYHLKNSPCDPCLVHCCMHWCALCQEHREMKNHLSDNVVMPSTAPPPVQQMSSTNEQKTDSPLAEPSKEGAGNNLELQPM
ncbi:hypothetical protein CDL15_Pgr019316 [Punica granatum]|uniref:Cell number regulator 6-like n=1 Tax=Punica granatum TaxID=22663 RepID=A0A218X6Z7_PUNGR|nr:hypothetical protein CDL15_Pgr019316 [Punica granatum]